MNHDIVWAPSPSQIRDTQMYAFMVWVAERHQLNFRDYHDLYQWSITDLNTFWEDLAVYLSIQFHEQPQVIVEVSDDFLHSIWFKGATLNYSEHLLRFHDDQLAIKGFNETGSVGTYTYAQLHRAVARCQAQLIACGVKRGDRVVSVLPNIPETLIAMLATTALGAVWSSCSPDFGAQTLLDRFTQIEPTVLIAVTGYDYKNKAIDISDKIKQCQQALSSLKQTLFIPYQKWTQAGFHAWPWLRDTEEPVRFEAVPFSHPLFILFSSGTTGLPKCIVHGHGGTLIQHLKELQLHTDIRRSDTLIYMTTCGWMMWNWMASALALGATVMLYEGCPTYPRTESVLTLCARESVTVLGTSAKYISLLMHEKIGVDSKDFPKLRTILSTGSPLLPEHFDYVYHAIKSDICLSSIAGGTDIISCFVLGNPILPVHRGEIQCRGLGMAVEIWNEQGQPVIDEKGELVCVKPFISMPVCFWSDPGDQKYHRAYFEKFFGVWSHSDYAMLIGISGIMIFGRSDAVLNPGGVRIGTAEIYRQVETLFPIQEALAIGQPYQDDIRIILFVILKQGHMLDEALKRIINERLRQNASPRHVPSMIIQVNDFPRTHNGKISELAVLKIFQGGDLDNQGALMNPEVLNEFKAIAKLQ